MVGRLAVFAGLARTTPANDLLVAASAEALASGGTAQHAHFWAATGMSADLFRLEAWREAGFASVADLVTRLFEEDFAPRDQDDLLAQLAKWRRADVARHAGGDLAVGAQSHHRSYRRRALLARQLVSRPPTAEPSRS